MRYISKNVCKVAMEQQNLHKEEVGVDGHFDNVLFYLI